MDEQGISTPSPVIPVLEFDPGIRERMREINRKGSDGKSIDQKNQVGRSDFFGLRRAELNKLLRRDDGTYDPKKIQSLLDRYDPRSNTFAGVLEGGNLRQRMAGLRADDIVTALSNYQQTQREKTPEYRRAVQLFPKEGPGRLSQLTTAEHIEDVIGARDKRSGLLSDISRTPGGRKILSDARAPLAEGQELTNSELEGILAQAEAMTPDAVSKRNRVDAQSALTQAQKDDIPEQTRLQRDTLNQDTAIRRESNNITRIVAQNNQELSEAKLELERARLEGDTIRQQQLLNHQTMISNKNIELQKALAQINSNDRQADRNYDREIDERNRRQTLMLMLMQGLGNVGRTIGSGF